MQIHIFIDCPTGDQALDKMPSEIASKLFTNAKTVRSCSGCAKFRAGLMCVRNKWKIRAKPTRDGINPRRSARVQPTNECMLDRDECGIECSRCDIDVVDLKCTCQTIVSNVRKTYAIIRLQFNLNNAKTLVLIVRFTGICVGVAFYKVDFHAFLQSNLVTA